MYVCVLKYLKNGCIDCYTIFRKVSQWFRLLEIVWGGGKTYKKIPTLINVVFLVSDYTRNNTKLGLYNE